jgi:hypothetical protein
MNIKFDIYNPLFLNWIFSNYKYETTPINHFERKSANQRIFTLDEIGICC